MTRGLPIIEPIIPKLSRTVPAGAEWRYEPKLDGFRGTLYIERDRAVFRSKRRNVMRRFQALADSLRRALPLREAILDGEIVVMRDQQPDFYALMFRRGAPEYAAFDLLWLDGADLRPLRFDERKRRLEELVRDTPIGFVESHAEPELFEAAVRMDLEGIVAKRARDPYSAESEWIKVKHPNYPQAEGRWKFFERR